MVFQSQPLIRHELGIAVRHVLYIYIYIDFIVMPIDYSHACGGTHPKSQGEMGHGRRRLVRSCHGTRGFISSQLCFGRTQ